MKLIFCPLDLPPIPQPIHDVVNQLLTADQVSEGNFIDQFWKKKVIRMPQSGHPLDSLFTKEQDWHWTDFAREHLAPLIDYLEEHLPFEETQLCLFLRPKMSSGCTPPHKDYVSFEENLPEIIHQNEPMHIRFVFPEFGRHLYFSKRPGFSAEEIHTSPILFPEMPKSSQAFIFDSSNLYHGVHEAPKERFVLSVSGIPDVSRLQHLIEKSRQKYSPYAITMQQLEASNLRLQQVLPSPQNSSLKKYHSPMPSTDSIN